MKKMITKKHSENKWINPQIDKLEVKGLCIHYVGSYGVSGKWFQASAQSTADYLNSIQGIYTGYNYIVDDKESIELVPPEKLTWHVASPLYREYTELADKYYRSCNLGASYYLIGIACVHREDGSFTAETMMQLRKLCRYLIAKYNIEERNIVRHYDITRKLCPAYYIKETPWNNLWNFIVN